VGSVFIILPLIAAIGALVYIVVRNIARVWLHHRLKMALLEKLEHRPELLHSFQELQELLDNSPAQTGASKRQDLTVTGVILAVIGVVCVVLYATAGSGSWAVGAYFGGVACVALGFVLALFGLLIRFLSLPPEDRFR